MVILVLLCEFNALWQLLMSAKPLFLCNSEELSAGKVIRCLECVSPNVEIVLGSLHIENSLKPRCYFLLLLQSIKCQGHG